MISNILKTIFKSGKAATESVGKSMDFIDEVLEKEVIVGTVENLKESSGKVVEKAGTLYQKTKDLIEDKTSDLSDTMLDSSETLKNVMKEGEDFVKKIIGNEEE